MASTDVTARVLRRNLGIITGAAVAVSNAAATIVGADSTGLPRTPEPAHLTDQLDVASWTITSGLSGLSPASLAPVADRSAWVDQSEVASWATAIGLAGMSPASLSAAE